MAQDMFSKAADFFKDAYEKGKKAKGEKLPDKELDKYEAAWKEVKKDVMNITVDEALQKLRKGFIEDLERDLGIENPKQIGIFWEQASREAIIEIEVLKGENIERARRPLDKLIAESTHARLQEMIDSKDPEEEGKSVFTEIANKFPGGKKGLAAGFSLLSFLGIKKGSKMEKFINYLKGLFGFEDEKKKDDKKTPETASIAQAEEEKKGPQLSPEVIMGQFTKAKIEIDQSSIDSDIDYLNKNKGTEKLDIGKRLEKGLAKGSSFMKIAESIKKGLKDKPFKFRLLDIRLDQLSDDQISKLNKSIAKKENLKPKVVRALLNDLSEPAKLAKVISNFEKTA